MPAVPVPSPEIRGDGSEAAPPPPPLPNEFGSAMGASGDENVRPWQPISEGGDAASWNDTWLLLDPNDEAPPPPPPPGVPTPPWRGERAAPIPLDELSRDALWILSDSESLPVPPADVVSGLGWPCESIDWMDSSDLRSSECCC